MANGPTDPPEPAPTPNLSTPPVSVQSLPLGAHVYISIQGDVWDMIAMRVYGAKRGNEHLMYRLIEANYYLRDLSHFPAGIPVVVPVIESITEIPLVPWKKSAIITT